MIRPMIRAAAFAAVMLCAPVADALAETGHTALAGLLSDFRARYGFPGATAAVALPDGTVLTAATGLADLEAQRQMQPDTPMLAASIGKSFVAATVLSLETGGLLSRSDLVSDHLGDLDWFSRLPNHATMTVGDLLRHASGLPDHVLSDGFRAEMARRTARRAQALTPEEAVAFVLDAEPIFPAGSGWAYSDTGYLLLGLIIENTSGRRYDALVSERFLSPLGLTGTRPSNTRHLPGLAVGYEAQDNPFGLPPRTMDDDGRLLWDPGVEWTGGGLMSTARDLAVWGQALLTGTALGHPYLDRLLDGIAVAPDAPNVRYGAGIAIHADTPRGTVIGHGGWVPGYVSSLRHYADHGVTVAFQINTDVGIADDTTDLVPALETALADLALAIARADEAAE